MGGAGRFVDWLTLCFIRKEVVDLRDSAVESNDIDSVVGSIKNQILAHDSQANEAKISTGFRLRRSTDIDAGETRTTVSITFLSIQCAMMNVQGKGVEFDVLMDPRVRLAGCENALGQHIARG